jgi:hypothetical protein
MNPKLTVSDQIAACYDYVELAEFSATSGDLQNSNHHFKRATDIAIYLLDTYNSGTFLDEEYNFLKQISKHFKDY